MLQLYRVYVIKSRISNSLIEASLSPRTDVQIRRLSSYIRLTFNQSLVRKDILQKKNNI